MLLSKPVLVQQYLLLSTCANLYYSLLNTLNKMREKFDELEPQGKVAFFQMVITRATNFLT